MADNATAVDQAPSTPVTDCRPRLVTSSTQTVNITKRFLDAASKVPAGTLIKDEQFTLFESVGALEIGDPKMDSGCVEEGDSLDYDFDVCRQLQLTELLWLMDELLSREVAWHMGYPLSQTLFTSVYIEQLLWPDPTLLSEAQFSKNPELRDADPMLHKVFRCYCLGLIKSCDLVLGMVTSQHYYEEEDFATQLYNRELLHRFAVDDILAEMEDAIHYMHTTVVDQSMKQSLDARMQFRFGLLSMLSSHSAAPLSPSPISIVTSSLLPSIQTSRKLGRPVSESFTLKIQRKLASTVPPRPMVTISEDQTFDYLNRFVRDCQNAFSVLCASHSQDLLTSYSIFCSQDPQPSVYVRALLQSWLNVNDLVGGISNELQFICGDMQSITLSASPIMQTTRIATESLTSDMKLVKQHLQDFVQRFSRSFLNIWRTACLNRCRVRRTLCHAAIEWDQIQGDAEELDEELQRLVGEAATTYPVGGMPTFSYSLSSWVYHYKLIQLRLVVQVGFELDVYAPHELSSMYWYLAHLCDTHLAHLERISFFVSRRNATTSRQNNRSAYEVGTVEESRLSLQHLYRLFSWLKASEATARALHGIYVVLQRHGQLQQPATTYASDKLRYELRMRPFLYLSVPEPVTYEQCRRLSNMEVRTDLEILEEAASHIVIAKKGWEEVLRSNWNTFSTKQGFDETASNVIDEFWTADLRGMMKATIGAGGAITLLEKHLRGQKNGVTLQIKSVVPRKGDNDYWHEMWRVPRIHIA